ncbi:MAG: MucB/RseB C-terminal domain-containing protein [Sulfuricellaceae bacterium]|nr:MucB/RseB C-terminal domain-containing protein [Sulfuricellaceae bacterium]
MSVLLILPTAVLADESEASIWLQKISSAAHRTNYSGTFIYYRDGKMETSRITHLVDGSGEHEKLEVLDGSPREIIRNNDEVVCFMPDSKATFSERRRVKAGFPAILPEGAGDIGTLYQVKLGATERVAGYECRNVMLISRDAFRYGHRLCAHTDTGLLLKSTTLNEKNEMVDQFSFSQLVIGGEIDRNLLKPKFAMNQSPLHPAVEMPVDAVWQVGSVPPGFVRIMGLKRSFPGKKHPTNHLVYSDHLAAVSIFIEPVASDAKAVVGISRNGAINIFTRSVNNHQVTVLGEVPEATVTQIGNSISFVPK